MFNSRVVLQNLFACMVFSACNVQSQSTSSFFTYHNFDEKILTYEPPQREGVVDKDYQKGKFFLSETSSATENDPKNLNAGDYWNITMAFLKLQEPKAHLEIAFQKAIKDSPEAICSYIAHLGTARLEEQIPEVFIPFYRSCEERTESKKANHSLSPKAVDQPLFSLMSRIRQNDQKYREGKKDMDKQRILDRKNQRLIDSLYQVYHTYLGRSMVGEQLEYTMWAVIQHSNLEMMERYLPVVEEAVREGELSGSAPLKMLIDRVYWLQYGYQIFGSQAGVDLAKPEVVESVRKKYGLK